MRILHLAVILAVSAGPGSVQGTGIGGSIEISGSYWVTGPEEPSEGAASRSGGAEAELVGLAPTSGVLANGVPCLGAAPAVFASAELAQQSTWQTFVNNDAMAGTPDCPLPAPAAGAAPVVVDPEQIAISFWRRVELPVPEPVIGPGSAITGNTAFLEVNSDLATQFDARVPGFGTLEIDASSEVLVDWGDGTGVQAYGSAGGPYPAGDVTHVYADAGVVDVVVTQVWSATWRLGGDGGTLGGLQTTGTIEDFEVRQIQAVLQR
jgi:hypothetical protein